MGGGWVTIAPEERAWATGAGMADGGYPGAGLRPERDEGVRRRPGHRIGAHGPPGEGQGFGEAGPASQGGGPGEHERDRGPGGDGDGRGPHPPPPQRG